MKVLGLAGHSDAGKTTLVESLVAQLSAERRVATVKSIHHDVEVDEPGTDTHRHRQAGAARVVGVTPSTRFTFGDEGKAGDESGALDRILDGLADDGFEVALVEGFAAAAIPTVIVGDRSSEGVGGRVVARVSGPDDAEPERLVAALSTLPAHETHRSLRRRLTAPDLAVATVELRIGDAASDLSRSLADAERALDARADVHRATTASRRSVTRDVDRVVHLGAAASARRDALVGAEGAHDRLRRALSDADVEATIRLGGSLSE